VLNKKQIITIRYHCVSEASLKTRVDLVPTTQCYITVQYIRRWWKSIQLISLEALYSFFWVIPWRMNFIKNSLEVTSVSR